MTEDDLDMTEEFDLVGLASGMQRVAIIFDGPEEAESWLKAQGLEFKKFNNGWQVNLSTGLYHKQGESLQPYDRAAF